MAHFSLDPCPHCGTQSTAWTVSEHARRDDPRIFEVFAICPGCDRGVILITESDRPQQQTPHDYLGNLSNAKGFAVCDVIPHREDPAAPKYLPEHIRSWYLQAIEDLQLQPKGKDYHVVAMLCRKILESALKQLAPELKGSLKGRIDKMADGSLLTPALKEWSHAIRILGNESVHDEEPVDHSSAQELLRFTELMLTYLFTLPGMVEASRNKPQP